MLSAENFTFALCKNIPFLVETGERVECRVGDWHCGYLTHLSILCDNNIIISLMSHAFIGTLFY